MKKRFSILALLSLSVLLMAGCKSSTTNSKTDDDTLENGQLSLSLSATTNFVVSTKAEDTTPVDLDDFTVRIYLADGTLNQSWPYSSMPESVTLEEGDYTVEAYNFIASGASFDAPSYYASEEITVVAQTLKTVNLECTISNVKVTVDLTDTFKEKVSDASVTVHNNEGMGSLVWTIDNIDDEGYFSVPATSKQLVVVVKGTITDKNTLIDNVSYTISDVEAAQWHKVSIDLVTTGTATTTISINSSLTEKNLNIDIPDSDGVIDNNGDQGSWDDESTDQGGTTDPDEPSDPSTPAGDLPTITGASFNGSPFDMSKTLTLSAAEVTEDTILDILFSSTADGGIQNLLLDITSDSEIIAGIFTEAVDLCNLSEGDIYDLLCSVGVIDPEAPIKGKATHTFSVGGLMGMLTLLGTDCTHNFKVTVVDANGQATETLVVYVTE
ncbi:MAG: DUF4493 domain-containing protein [Rikenellaceae bacterium]